MTDKTETTKAPALAQTLDELPSWDDLAEKWALEIVNKLNLPYGEGKDKDIRKALHVMLELKTAFRDLVLTGVKIGEENAEAN